MLSLAVIIAGLALFTGAEAAREKHLGCYYGVWSYTRYELDTITAL